ncbi:hypothetical protein D9M69_418570 [compost metagenome]
MGIIRVLRILGDGQHVEPDRCALLGQAHVHHHAVTGLLGAIGRLGETAGVTHGHADVTIGDIGHVF